MLAAAAAHHSRLLAYAKSKVARMHANFLRVDIIFVRPGDQMLPLQHARDTPPQAPIIIVARVVQTSAAVVLSPRSA
jgi:hypothetical protein